VYLTHFQTFSNSSLVEKNTPASPSRISSNNSPYSIKVLPKKRIGRVSAFDSIEEEPKAQPSPPKPPVVKTFLVELFFIIHEGANNHYRR
jgi:hypothetical protein